MTRNDNITPPRSAGTRCAHFVTLVAQCATPELQEKVRPIKKGEWVGDKSSKENETGYSDEFTLYQQFLRSGDEHHQPRKAKIATGEKRSVEFWKGETSPWEFFSSFHMPLDPKVVTPGLLDSHLASDSQRWKEHSSFKLESKQESPRSPEEKKAWKTTAEVQALGLFAPISLQSHQRSTTPLVNEYILQKSPSPTNNV